jgi:ABC-type sugar transport system substrate-binding protein
MIRVPRGRRAVGAIAIAVVLSAGGVSAAALGGTTSSHQQKPKVTLVLHIRLPEVEIFGDGAKQAAKELGFPLRVVGNPTYDVLKQQQLSDAEVNAGAKGVIEILVPPEPWRRNLTALLDRGIKVVNIGVYTGPFMGKRTPIYVGPNDKKYGRALGNLVLGALGSNPKGEIVIGTCVPGLLELEDRITAVREVMRQKAPGVKVSKFFAADDPSKGIADWQKLTQVHSKALAFIGLCSTAPGLLARIKKETGAKWIAAGGELDPRSLAGVKDGQLLGVVGATVWVQGYIGARLIYEEIVHGKYANRTGWIDTGQEVVTKNNVDKYLAWKKDRSRALAFYRPMIRAIVGNLNAHIQPLLNARK